MAGNYELIFPFNRKSEEISFALNRMAGGKAQMGGPNLLKMVVNEIKAYEQDYLAFVKNGRQYAPQTVQQKTNQI